MRRRLLRMRIKRVLTYCVLLFALTTGYVYYTLYFKPEPASFDVQGNLPRQQTSFKEPADDPQAGKQRALKEQNKDGSNILQLFPQGIQRLWNGEQEAEKVLDKPPVQAANNVGGEDDIMTQLKKKQKIIQDQADLLHQLRKQVRDNANRQAALPENRFNQPQPDRDREELLEAARRRKESIEHSWGEREAQPENRLDQPQPERDDFNAQLLEALRRRKEAREQSLGEREAQPGDRFGQPQAERDDFNAKLLEALRRRKESREQSLRERELQPEKQFDQPQPPMDEFHVNLREAIRRRKESLANAADGVNHIVDGGIQGGNKVMQLAVNGVQPRVRGRQNRMEQEAPAEQNPGMDALKMFQRAQQQNPQRLFNRQVHPVAGLPPVPKVHAPQGQILDSERLFQRAGQHALQQNNRFQNRPLDSGSYNVQNKNHFLYQKDKVQYAGRPGMANAVNIRRKIAAYETNSSEHIREDDLDQPPFVTGQPPDVGFVSQSSLENIDEREKLNFQDDLVLGHDSPLLAERFKRVQNVFEKSHHEIKPNEGLENAHDNRMNWQKDTDNNDFNLGLNDHNIPNVMDAFHVKVKNLSEPVEGNVKCVPLRIRMLTRNVCVYPHYVDTRMSRQLIQTATFTEELELMEFEAALATDSSLAAVDIGAGLGVYSLAAAIQHRQVLAVEPLNDTQRLFTKTMQINSLTNQVTLVTDALGDVRGVGIVRSPHPRGNMGTVYVDPVKNMAKVGSDVSNLVRIVQLDDLLPLVTFSRAVMKMDVQGDEERVLRGAWRFFDKVDIRYVLMHWLPTFDRHHLQECQEFLNQHGYIPAESVTGKVYSLADLEKDINFVVWRKNVTQSF